MADRKISAANSSVRLQENATSTVAGALFDVEQSGTYRFYVSGTLDTTTRPQLFVKPKGAAASAVYEDAATGVSATLSKAGTGIEVDLVAGDEVNSQNTVSGGTYNYTTHLGRIK